MVEVQHLTDEDYVVASFVLKRGTTLEPCHTPCEQRYASNSGVKIETREALAARGEPAGKLLLIR